MKKAEEYFTDFCSPHNGDLLEVKYDVVLILKRIQKDAIEEAVKRCAEQAEVNLYTKGLYKGAKWHKLEDGDSYNPLENSVMAKLEKKSILSVAKQLIKELSK